MDLNKPERINEAAQALLQKRFDKVEPKFVKAVVEWITKFKTTNGSIIRTKANTDRLSKFSTAVNRFLLNAGYNAMLDGFLENFDAVSDAQIEIHGELNDIKLTRSFINPFKSWAVNNVISDMVGQGLNENLINPLRSELFIAVNQGSTLTDVITSIAGQLTTTESRQGVLKRIALQASRDALGQYDGIVNEAVRKSYRLDALLYVGSLVKDSRAQCERWVDYDKHGKVGMILFEDLEQEIEWAENNGTGMIPNTTPENFCQNRGGFNCRHICYPIRRPKEKEAEPEAQKVPEVKLGFDKKFDEYVNSEDINDEAKILIDRLPKPKEIKLNNNASFYQNEIISLRKTADKNTFIHEYGHHIDKSNVSLDKIFKNAYDDDLKYLKKEYGKIDEMIPKLLKEFRDENGRSKSEFNGASDILDSLTKGRVYDDYYGYGHGKSYYKNDLFRHKENFANIFEAWSKTDKTQIEVIQKLYPNLYSSFLELIKKL